MRDQEIKKELRTVDGRLEVRDDAEEETIVEGYAAVFYREDDPGTEFKLWGDLVERIDPGAFGRALAEKDDAAALFNHNPDLLLARVASETLTLSVDDIGLKYAFAANFDDPDHVRVVEKIRRGDLAGSSFAFAVDSQRFDTQEDGPDIRTILSVELFDVSPVTYPAYEATNVGLRSSESLREVLAARDAWREAEGRKPAQVAGAKCRGRVLELERKRLTVLGGSR